MPDIDNRQDPNEKSKLYEDFLEAIAQNVDDPEQLAEFQNPEWFDRVTEDNLRNLTQSEKDATARRKDFIKKFRLKDDDRE